MEYVNTVRAACLFASDKYRKATDLGRRLGDTHMEEHCGNHMRTYLEINNALPEIQPVNKPTVVRALDAMIDELNRQHQNLMLRGAVNEGAIFEGRLTAAYAARRQMLQETAAA